MFFVFVFYFFVLGLLHWNYIQFVPTRSKICCHRPISSESNLKMKGRYVMEEIIGIDNIAVACASIDKKIVFIIYVYYFSEA